MLEAGDLLLDERSRRYAAEQETALMRATWMILASRRRFFSHIPIAQHHRRQFRRRNRG
jgi:hypothetical protein